MAQRCVVARRVPETLERRHLDEIGGRREEGVVSAMANCRAGVSEETVHMRNALDWIQHGIRAMIVQVGHAIDLLVCGCSRFCKGFVVDITS
jgi:predicted neutral ceramidase superfamily lipid hydrolase